MKTFAKILFPIIAFTQSALASTDNETLGIVIQPKARFDFAAGFLDNKGYNSKERISVNRNKFGFLSQGRFILNAQNKLDNNISYGAQISINTTSRVDRSTPSHLFFESNAGKWELGSDKSVMTKMKITGYTHASATGGSWDAWVRTDIRNNGVQYVTNPGNFLDTKSRLPKDLEYSRKISYYTPKLSGFQLGVSYIPDTTNSGGSPVRDDAPDYHMDKMVPGYKFDIKDGFALGLSKEHQFSDALFAKVSLVGETGKVAVRTPTPAELRVAQAKNNPLVDPKDVKFKKLQTYNIGAEVKYGKFAISGCYTNYMKSLTANTPLIDPHDRKKSYLYNFGAKYNFSKLSMSAHYLHTNNKKNIVDATTIGIDYKLAPGLMPYAEVTFFNAKGAYKKQNTVNEYTPDNHHGGLVLIGMKLDF